MKKIIDNDKILNYFFKRKFSGMVLYVEVNSLTGTYKRKANEIDIINLKLKN